MPLSHSEEEAVVARRLSKDARSSCIAFITCHRGFTFPSAVLKSSQTLPAPTPKHCSPLPLSPPPPPPPPPPTKYKLSDKTFLFPPSPSPAATSRFSGLVLAQGVTAIALCRGGRGGVLCHSSTFPSSSSLLTPHQSLNMLLSLCQTKETHSSLPVYIV
ncbi:unnamed protein product [Boreogadus saida]